MSSFVRAVVFVILLRLVFLNLNLRDTFHLQGTVVICSFRLKHFLLLNV